jgi:hypothetical protein
MTWLKRLRPSPALRVMLIVLAVCVVLDFTLRVMVWREGGSAPKAIPALVAPPAGEPVEQILQRIQASISFDAGSAGPAAASPDALLLRAVSVGRAGARAVLALKGPDGQITRHVRVGVGDEVEGWRVSDIQSRKVIVQREKDTHELVLFRPAAAANGGI